MMLRLQLHPFETSEFLLFQAITAPLALAVRMTTRAWLERTQRGLTYCRTISVRRVPLGSTARLAPSRLPLVLRERTRI